MVDWLRQMWGRIGALALAALVGGLSLPAVAVASSAPVRLGVSAATATGPLPADFIGLGIEYNEVPMWAQTISSSSNPLLGQLIGGLDPGGRPVLRIGGLSTERTWWPLKGMARPRGLTTDLTPQWMAQARSLAQATHTQLLPGVNLEINRPYISHIEAQQLIKGLGPDLMALEIGNEPELYTLIPWYHVLAGKLLPWYSPKGTPVFDRRPTYGPAQFMQEFGRTLAAMPTGVRLAGPVTGNPNWLRAFAPDISRSSRIRTITWHAYGLNECVSDPRSPQFPSVPNLLSQTASRGFINGIGGFVGQAHQAGEAFRVDELGSVTCNGRAGVSNTMASALWAMDALFQMVADGIDGVNLHTYPGTSNSLFDFNHAASGWQGTVHPIYYGALMFAQADPVGARLLRTSLSAPTTIRAWATRAPDHRTRILLINDSLRSGAQATVSIARARGAAAVTRLTAPSAYATSDITLGGHSFPTRTSTGILPPSSPQAIVARGGVYSVSLPAASAALVTVPAPSSTAARAR